MRRCAITALINTRDIMNFGSRHATVRNAKFRNEDWEWDLDSLYVLGCIHIRLTEMIIKVRRFATSQERRSSTTMAQSYCRPEHCTCCSEDIQADDGDVLGLMFLYQVAPFLYPEFSPVDRAAPGSSSCFVLSRSVGELILILFPGR